MAARPISPQGVPRPDAPPAHEGPSVRHLAYIGLGSNLGDARATLHAALRAIAALPGTTLEASSGLWRSAPLGYTEQPDFLNAVARVRTDLAPLELLAALLQIESAFGRTRSFRNAPRTLDLDLLLYDALSLCSDTLQLPHPRMHERAFVLAPLAALDPALEIPGRGRITTLLDALGAQRLERLPEPA
jgi:2-amino-4-hydroxy-6-hydroxymethyldihydropteridine diphosphokinase